MHFLSYFLDLHNPSKTRVVPESVSIGLGIVSGTRAITASKRIATRSGINRNKPPNSVRKCRGNCRRPHQWGKRTAATVMLGGCRDQYRMVSFL